MTSARDGAARWTRGRPAPRLLLIAASVLVSVVAAELLLRVAAGPMWHGHFVLLPGTDWTIVPAPDVVRGVAGGHYRVNARGIRGRAFGADAAEYRLLAVGGSTTESGQLDDADAWTSRLERALPATADGRSVWVGNVGRSGLTTREHVLHLKYLLAEYPRIDAVIAMVGINDMLSALRRGSLFRLPAPITDPEAERDDLARAFVLTPGLASEGRAGWLRTTALWQAARHAGSWWQLRKTVDLHGTQGLVRARDARARARVVRDDLPSLEAPIEEYRRNLRAMADIAAARGVRLVFVTSPSLWRKTMPADEMRSLWMGWLGSDWSTADGYFSTGALARAMELFNQTLLDVCRERGVECIDAASQLPRAGDILYDDVHFTAEGARQLAALLARQLEDRPPFRRRS